MKKVWLLIAVIGALCVFGVSSSLAQAGPPQPKGQQPALTAEEQATLAQAKDLQKQLSIARLELQLAVAKEQPEKDIAQRAEETYRLQGQLYALRAKNPKVFKKAWGQRHRGGRGMGMGPGMGQGRGGRGMGGPGMGQGRGGRGMDMGPGMGQGRSGRGMGMGPGMGQGRDGRGMGPGMGRGRGGCGMRWTQPPSGEEGKAVAPDNKAVDEGYPAPPPPPAE